MATAQCAHTTLQSGGLQVLFCRGGHWIVVSTMGCPPNTVNIYDSVYKDIDATTKGTLAHLLGIPETDLCVNMAQVMQQVRRRLWNLRSCSLDITGSWSEWAIQVQTGGDESTSGGVHGERHAMSIPWIDYSLCFILTLYIYHNSSCNITYLIVVSMHTNTYIVLEICVNVQFLHTSLGSKGGVKLSKFQRGSNNSC